MTKTVLLVDDNEALLFAFKKLSNSCDFIVETADSIESAMMMLSNRHYDIVISDLNMSGITTREGYDIVKKAKMVNPSIRSFIWTAYDNEVERETAAAIGVEGFLAKPVTFSVISSIIDSPLLV